MTAWIRDLDGDLFNLEHAWSVLIQESDRDENSPPATPPDWQIIAILAGEGQGDILLFSGSQDAAEAYLEHIAELLDVRLYERPTQAR